MLLKHASVLLVLILIPATVIWLFSYDPSERRKGTSLLPIVEDERSWAKLDTEENRVTKTILIEKMDEPLQLASNCHIHGNAGTYQTIF